MKKELILAFILLITSCKFSNKYENRESDRIAAEQVTGKLFGCLKSSNYTKATTLFAKDFFNVTSKEALNEIFSVTEGKLGRFLNAKLLDWQTVVSEGAISTGQYQIRYEGQFENGTAEMIIYLISTDNEPIKITTYRINS